LHCADRERQMLGIGTLRIELSVATTFWEPKLQISNGPADFDRQVTHREDPVVASLHR
jgi:hypothetical protein